MNGIFLYKNCHAGPCDMQRMQRCLTVENRLLTALELDFRIESGFSHCVTPFLGGSHKSEKTINAVHEFSVWHGDE